MSKPRITALEIEKKEFSYSLRGYNSAEVRAYLERVAEEVENLESEIRSLRDRLSIAEADRERMKLLEDKVKDALVVAQSAADDARANARKEAELILREAEMGRARAISEIERLRAEKSAFIAQIKSYLNAFYEKLNMPSEAAVYVEEREAG
jgi:cell division initiation protein